MIFRWTSESVIAAVAVAVSTLGGVTTTAIHWGSVNTQIENVQTQQKVADDKVEKLSEDSTEQKIHNAKVEQSLADVIARLDDIQTQVRKSNGNHE
jgi:septal ring factor EnvC (AmiA/AmiB activator)